MWLVALIRRQQQRERRDRQRDGQTDAYSSIRVQIEDALIPSRSSLLVRRRQGREGEDHEASGRELAPVNLLYSLARRWAWQAVTFRCISHPHEASTEAVDRLGDTVLHWAAFGNPPLEPVAALLSINPELARVQNNKGFLPLHVACSYKASPDVLQAILDAYPDAAGIPNHAGTYPLHLLCDYGCAVACIWRILQTEQGRATTRMLDRVFRRRPIAILNARKNLRTFQVWLETVRNARTRQRQIRHAYNEEYDEDSSQAQELARLEQIVANVRREAFWCKLSLLVLAEVWPKAMESIDGLNDNDDQLRAKILYSFVGSQSCPLSLQELAILLYEDSLLTPAEQSSGQLPIHLAVELGNEDLVNAILHSCPNSARSRNRSGELPLTIALKHADAKWSRGIGALVESNPAGLSDFADFDAFLYSEAWSRLSSTEALYSALRSSPGIVCQSYA